MSRALAVAWRLVKGLPLAFLTPFAMAFSAAILLVADAIQAITPRKPPPPDQQPNTRSATVVIPNWNGRDLLEKYLPPLIEAVTPTEGGLQPARGLSHANQDLGNNEIIVVDNGSTDGSAQFMRDHFPQVTVLALKENLGFGGGSNAGFAAAKNDIVVLLNSDMRVDRDFLQPLLAGFTDEKTFAVSCQIFFSDVSKLRQETGLTEGWWQGGTFHVGHRIEPDLDQCKDDNRNETYPCFYGGGGSCAFDRRKFLQLGGFDPLYHPFYLEDTDLGYLAWKRGWKVLYAPQSIVYHEHRGTIGKTFTEGYIQCVLRKNWILFVWKNIHHWPWLLSNFAYAWSSATIAYLTGDPGSAPDRATNIGILRAVAALPQAIASRRRAQHLSQITDKEAFRRPLGGHFRDTFELSTIPTTRDPQEAESPAPIATNPKLSVLFVSPYPICPPIHGGGVFMNQTVRELAPLCNLHLIILLDHERERAAHDELVHLCASVQFIVRLTGKQKTLLSIAPHATTEYRNRDLAWRIHQTIYTQKIDVLQLEYTVMGQYAGQYRHIPSILFEHDVYFQSIARRLPYIKGVIERVQARWEYLRALRYELKLLPKMDRVQVCSRDNAQYLQSFLPQLKGRLDASYRAGIDTRQYAFNTTGREPFTLLFLGSFRHLPNVEALDWFLKEVFPKIRASEPRARLILVGSDPPPRHFLRTTDGIEMVGFVEDVREPLARYSVFVCPILAGSGVRVKLLEAFAAGIPVVSTTVGAEGLVDPKTQAWQPTNAPQQTEPRASASGQTQTSPQQQGSTQPQTEPRASASGIENPHSSPNPQPPSTPAICALADDPAQFAAHVVRLLQNPAEAAALAHQARANVVATRDMQTITRALLTSYQTELHRMRRPQN